MSNFSGKSSDDDSNAEYIRLRDRQRDGLVNQGYHGGAMMQSYRGSLSSAAFYGDVVAHPPPPPPPPPQPIQHTVNPALVHYGGGYAVPTELNGGQYGQYNGKTIDFAQYGRVYTPDMLNYITKSFALVKDARDQAYLDQHLRFRIDQHRIAGTLHTYAWENEPIPSLPSDGADTIAQMQPWPRATAISHGVRAPEAVIPSRRKRRFASSEILTEEKMNVSTLSASTSSSYALEVHGNTHNNTESLSVGEYSSSSTRELPSSANKKRNVNSHGERISLNISSTQGRGAPLGIYGPASLGHIEPDSRAKGNTPKGYNDIRREDNVEERARAGIIYDTDGTASKTLLRKRKDRFFSPSLEILNRVGAPSPPSTDEEGYNPVSFRVVGVCQILEKEYLRLTAAPDPVTVRPEPVLKEYMSILISRWESREMHAIALSRNDAADDDYNMKKFAADAMKADNEAYLFMCSQLKAIRQDLTVQHIVNDFSVEVYENHARIALESGDMNEYNQCQTQLMHFYELGIIGCEDEFTAYRILYYMQLITNRNYDSGSSDLLRTMRGISTHNAVAIRQSSIAHALAVREAVQNQNWWRLFKHLYACVPNHGKYILNLMSPTWRLRYLKEMCRAYRPHISVTSVLDRLGYKLMKPDPQGQEGWQGGIEFLVLAGASFLASDGTPTVGDSLFNEQGSVQMGPDDGLLLDTAHTIIAAKGDLAALL